MIPVQVGEANIYSVSDGNMTFSRDTFFNGLSQDDWKSYSDYQGSEFAMNVGSFIISTHESTVLVDTGLGKLDHQIKQPTRETLLPEINEAGFSPKDVDTVFITHLHLDHVGTNMTDTPSGWIPTFPNARYMVSREDWSLFTRLSNSEAFSYIRQQVQPLMDKGILELFDGETKVSGEITTLPTPGHTPGHSSLLISSEGQKAVIVGDAAHIPPQAQETQWSPSPDRDKELSAKSRAMVMDLIEREHALLASGHFPSPGFGNLVRVESKRLYIPLS